MRSSRIETILHPGPGVDSLNMEATVAIHREEATAHRLSMAMVVMAVTVAAMASIVDKFSFFAQFLARI